ncbi:signal transduction histidine kinase [Nitrobacteraceae bacterium AZCC 1564]
MTTTNARSLRWHLIRRLVALQAGMLTAIVLLVIGGLWAGGYLVSLEPDDDTIEIIRNAIHRSADGRISMQETPALVRQRTTLPDLWFVVRDRSGHTVSQGPVPEPFAKIGGALDSIGQARLGWNIGDRPRPTARVKWVSTPNGDIQIMTGPGGSVSWRRVASATSTLFLTAVAPAVLLMTLATLLATPIVVRKSLEGLGQAASHAATIDIDKRGTRLPLQDVPTEIAPLISAMNDALRRLDEGYQRHKRFLVDAAHELRTPIAILQTRLESLPSSPEISRVLEDVARLSTLAEQLLDLQRIGQVTNQFKDVDLVSIGRKVVGDLAPLAISAGYELSFESDIERACVRGDEGSLERALTNLIQNAIQYGGRKGAISVCVDEPATISVTDQGPGVPLKHRQRIFEPFYRLHGFDRGAGLGLNLVQEIVRLHDGQIAMLDGPEGGARVRMSFPPAPRVA